MRSGGNSRRIVLFILALLSFLFFASCSPRIIKEIITDTKIEYRDSLVYRDTTIRVPIPLEKDQAIVHIGDTSKLETSVAESIAYIDSTGFLHHKLENKKGSLSTVVKIPEHYHFTVSVSTTKETITKTEYKEKPLNWWQSFRLKAFWWMLGIIALLLVWTFRKLIF